MWIVDRTPEEYKVNPHADVKDWCILNPCNGEVFDFYFSKEAAVEAFRKIFTRKGAHDLTIRIESSVDGFIGYFEGQPIYATGKSMSDLLYNLGQAWIAMLANIPRSN